MQPSSRRVPRYLDRKRHKSRLDASTAPDTDGCFSERRQQKAIKLRCGRMNALGVPSSSSGRLRQHLQLGFFVRQQLKTSFPRNVVSNFGQPFAQVLDIQEGDGLVHGTRTRNYTSSLRHHVTPQSRHGQDAGMNAESLGGPVDRQPPRSLPLVIHVSRPLRLSTRHASARADCFRSR